jgi:hypothetical protein
MGNLYDSRISTSLQNGGIDSTHGPFQEKHFPKKF